MKEHARLHTGWHPALCSLHSSSSGKNRASGQDGLSLSTSPRWVSHPRLCLCERCPLFARRAPRTPRPAPTFVRAHCWPVDVENRTKVVWVCASPKRVWSLNAPYGLCVLRVVASCESVAMPAHRQMVWTGQPQINRITRHRSMPATPALHLDCFSGVNARAC